MTDTSQVHTLPITLAPVADVIPHSWVIQLEATYCVHCQTRKTHAIVYAKTHLRSRTGQGKYVTNLRPVRSVTEITHDLPIEPMRQPDRVLPFCDECFDNVSLSHLPKPPPPAKQLLNSGTTDAPTTKAAKTKTPPTIDDLLV